MLKGSQTTASNYLIKQLPKATAFLNTKFELVHVSDQWKADFEFDQRDIIGQTIYDLFESVDKELQQVLEVCMLGKGGEKGVQKFLDSSKKERWFEWTNIPWFDQNENIIGIIIQTDEITPQVESLAKLEKLELINREKSEIAKIGSWEYDITTGSLHWCQMTKRIHGVDESYQPDIDAAIEFYREGYSRNTISLAIYKAMEQGIPWSEKLQLVTAQGRDIWVIAAGKPHYKDGMLHGLLGTFQDITDLVQSEMKTRESEHLLRTVVDNLPLNVYIKDLNSRKILVNKSECDYLDKTDASELLGKSDFELYPKEIAQISRDEDLSVLNTLTPILGKESIIVKNDGSATTFLTSKIPLIGTNNKAYGLLGISMDISNLKKQESELRDLINVTSLQNKKLINFAHIVSHNLRSHTANFSMLLDFLATETDKAEQQRIIEMLTVASDNLLETMDNLNEVISINTNVGQAKKEVALSDKIHGVVTSLSSFLSENEATIANEVDNKTHVKVVPAYLDSILMNFITNAIKYRHPERPPVITLSAEKTEGYTVLSISDNGLGIDLKKHGDKLFGMYKTFHENTEARGIGLFITKNQVEAMEGKITVNSKVGKGTTFNVHFHEKN